MVRDDNFGVVLMAGNIIAISCMKHVDIGYEYVNNYVGDGIVKIVFVKSTENDSDMLMKNLSGDLMQSIHAKWQVRSQIDLQDLETPKHKRKSVKYVIMFSAGLFHEWGSTKYWQVMSSRQMS